MCVLWLALLLLPPLCSLFATLSAKKHEKSQEVAGNKTSLLTFFFENKAMKLCFSWFFRWFCCCLVNWCCFEVMKTDCIQFWTRTTFTLSFWKWHLKSTKILAKKNTKSSNFFNLYFYFFYQNFNQTVRASNDNRKKEKSRLFNRISRTENLRPKRLHFGLISFLFLLCFSLLFFWTLVRPCNDEEEYRVGYDYRCLSIEFIWVHRFQWDEWMILWNSL